MSIQRDNPQLRGVGAIEQLPPSDPLRRLHDDIRMLLHKNRSTLLYHGWPHAYFVTKHAMLFARDHAADETVVGSAALVHDLNYLVRPDSEPTAGAGMITARMLASGFSKKQAELAVRIINEANLGARGPEISIEAACLSDADTLFKALPFTPILLAPAYLLENGVTLRELATKIVREQLVRLEDGYYFYFSEVKDRYEVWARENIAMWQRVLEALNDDELSWLSDQLSLLNKEE
ncbi:HD domain-containing protein [Rhodococcus qingshengii]